MIEERNLNGFGKLLNISWNRSAYRLIFSERELAFTFAIYMLSPVRLSVCRLSATFVHATQAIEILGNVSTPFNTLVINLLTSR